MGEFEFEMMDETETSKESLRLSLFRENSEWDRKEIKRQESCIVHRNKKQEELDSLIEINYVYIYEQDEIMVKKNKTTTKGEGSSFQVYKSVCRRWETLEKIRNVEFFKQNYDIQQNKVEIVILCKKYISHPRVEQLEELLNFLETKAQKQIYSLLSSACLLNEFFQSQVDTLSRRKQQLNDMQEEQKSSNQSKQDKKKSIEKEQQNNQQSNQVKDINKANQDGHNHQQSDDQETSNLGNQYEQQMFEDNMQKINAELEKYNKKVKIMSDWIWKLVDHTSMKLKYSNMMKYLLISIQYEFSSLSQYLYAHLREYILRYQDVISQEINNAFLQQVIRNSASEYLQCSPQSEIITINCISQFDSNKVEQLQIDTVFFKKDFQLFYQTHSLLKEQKPKYQYFNVERTRTDNLEDFGLTESDYPHIYHLRYMHDKKQLLIGIQESEHSNIEIYIERQYSDNVEVSFYKKFSQNYVGYIERNYWGTQFTLYSEGYASQNNRATKEHNPNNQKDYSYSLLRYFLPVEKCQNQNYSLIINYETNIMADAPRKFTAKSYNYKEKRFIETKSLEPVYNEETQTYQLNFYGRAKKASARNFQVQDINDDDQVFLLHGKNKKDQFSLDFSYPINIMQAFAFSIVSISKKFLVA